MLGPGGGGGGGAGFDAGGLGVQPCMIHCQGAEQRDLRIRRGRVDHRRKEALARDEEGQVTREDEGALMREDDRELRES